MNGTGAFAKKEYSIAKDHYLRKTREYQAVYRKGRRLRGHHFSLIYLPNHRESNRLGISIHGVKKAVKRNRIKRIIREFFRLNRYFIVPPSDIVVTVRKQFIFDTPAQVDEAVRKLLTRSAVKRG